MAYHVNPHVPELLLSERPLPVVEHFTPGSPEEAVVCMHELRPAFEATKWAMEWLAEELAERDCEDRTHRKEQRRKERQKQKKKKRR